MRTTFRRCLTEKVEVSVFVLGGCGEMTGVA